jgi:hypothetical protein
MTIRERSPQTVEEALESVQFVFGQDGQPTAVILDIAGWEVLLDWLESIEDRASVQAMLPRLRQGPDKANALRWEGVEAEWDDETA